MQGLGGKEKWVLGSDATDALSPLKQGPLAAGPPAGQSAALRSVTA